MPKVISDAAAIDALLDFYGADLQQSRRDPKSGATVSPGTKYAEACRLGLGLYRPQVALFWGKDLSYSQLDMYRPYLQRTGRRFVVMAKSLKGKTPDKIGLPSVPVFLAEHGFVPARDLEGISSLDAVLHITEASENYQFIKRFPNFIHVFANHSDSDKLASINRLATAYDYLLVPDRGGMMRYLNAGIPVPQDNFALIGGAPIEGADVAGDFGAVRNILYTPTWEGHGEAVDFSSVPKIADRIAGLVAQGHAFRFRPHPGLGKKSARHKAGATLIRDAIAASRKTGKAEDFNWSDAILSDISGVMSEYLFTRKPVIVPIGGQDDWVRAYFAETTLSDYVYPWEYEVQGFEEVLERATADPLRAQRIARSAALFHGAGSVDALCGLFERALDLFERVRAQRALRAPPIRAWSMRPNALFSATPEDPGLRGIVEDLRAGTRILHYPA